MTVFDPLARPTRDAALARLNAFLPNSGRKYATSRNVDYGPSDRSNVSMLSPFIRHRLLLESEVLDAVLCRFAPSTAEKFIQEVFWRTYFKGWLEQRPSVWRTYKRDVARLSSQINEDADFAQRYSEAVEGRTGIACFDAWVGELIETGYLHNHTRMWFASIWMFTLELPWQLGADFFYRHLLDGDPASNTLSWRWVGGLHTKGKTYLARSENIRKFTNGRYAPGGQLASVAPAFDEADVHGRRPLPHARHEHSGSPAIVLITEEDCVVESLCPRDGLRGGVACLATSHRSPLPVGEPARHFSAGAVEDAAARAADYFGIAITRCDEADDWANAIEHACRQADVSTVVTAYAPVGPVAEQLAECHADLERRGIRLTAVRREFDDLVWPHATKGFFGLKAKIPNMLEQMQRDAAGAAL